MKPYIHECTLDRQWRIDFYPEDLNEEGRPRLVEIMIAARYDGEWESEIEGQVKVDGRADWGLGKDVVMHFCGAKDCEIFSIVYKIAAKMMDAEQ